MATVVQSEAGIQLEETTCPVCDHDDFVPELQVRDRFALHGPVFRIVRCRNCQLRYLNPRPAPESMALFYRHAEYQPFLSAQDGGGAWDRIYARVRGITVRNKRRKIAALAPQGGRLLDVGCGTGEFLQEMQRSGWQVTGLESDARAADFARSRYGLEVTNGSLAGFSAPEGSFDVITMWHVLEHLHAPKSGLRRIRNLLRPDGWILIACPNRLSLDAQFYRENWVAWDAPRHLLHLAPQDMQRLCRSLDLRLINWQQLPLDAFYNCLMSEKLRKVREKRNLIFPLYLLRAFVLATVSMAQSTRLRAPENRQGSSVLYFIKKNQEESDHESL